MGKRAPLVPESCGRDLQNSFRESADRHGIPDAVAGVAEALWPLAELTHGSTERDAIFAIASMTKPITSAAALQLVERGVLRMDEPVHRFLPELRDLPVLEGFNDTGSPLFSVLRFQVTLRQLLNHTAGFAYPWNHPLALQYAKTEGKLPFLVHQPGTRWHYGTNIDWVGRLVEEASGEDLETYFRRHVTGPLGMPDTSFEVPPEKLRRLATTHQRNSFGELVPAPRVQLAPPPFCNGGGGLFSTVGDYLRFLQMILREGLSPDGERILEAGSVHQMTSNQVGGLDAGRIYSVMPERSQNVDFQRGGGGGFGFGFLINHEPYTEGRAAGSLSWAGIRNTFYWVDPRTGIAAVLFMQFLPFCDSAALAMLQDFESAVYRSLR